VSGGSQAEGQEKARSPDYGRSGGAELGGPIPALPLADLTEIISRRKGHINRTRTTATMNGSLPSFPRVGYNAFEETLYSALISRAAMGTSAWGLIRAPCRRELPSILTKSTTAVCESTRLSHRLMTTR
jgi:hypothetical protein